MAGEEIEGDLWYQSLGHDLLSCLRFRVLVSEHYPQPLCKIWGAETHVSRSLLFFKRCAHALDPYMKMDVLRKL